MTCYDACIGSDFLGSGVFLVASMYNALIHPDILVHNNWVKISLKMKMFAWYLRRGMIITKDNHAKRNWQGSQNYVFYHHAENIKHLFFSNVHLLDPVLR
jgi:hypothetical protein